MIVTRDTKIYGKLISVNLENSEFGVRLVNGMLMTCSTSCTDKDLIENLGHEVEVIGDAHHSSETLQFVSFFASSIERCELLRAGDAINAIKEIIRE